jgi:hypothetical protein
MYDEYLKIINGTNDYYKDGNPKLQIYSLKKTKKTFKSSVSWQVLKVKEQSYIGAAHCQEGQNGELYNINWVGDKVISTVGGKVKISKIKNSRRIIIYFLYNKKIIF